MNAQFMRCARVCVAALSFISLFSLPPARAAELCGTMQEWLATPQAKAFRDRAKLTGVCPTNGLCDVPSTRDAAIANANTPLKIIPLRFHVIANDDGSDPAGTPGEIQAQVDNLNADFAGARIRFTYSMRTISNSTLRFVGAATGNVMRATLAENPEQQFNIFVTRYTNFNNCGIATYPWDSRALTSTGGMRLQDFSVAPGRFGRQSAFVECVTHEMGHMLGLLHTFAGTTEWTSSCQDCRELAGRNTFDGDRTGDYCSDTPPDSGFTSLVAPCTDGGTNRDTCATGSPFYTGLDTNNYMSYFLACYSQFTPQQVGRMHCWTANSLSSMLVTDSTPPVVAITSPADMIETNSLSPITGWTTDDIFVQSVGVTIREIVPGGGGRFWNGTNWQGTAFTLPTTLTGTNWALASGVALPPLNSGISYVVTASAVDGQFNAASTTATVQAPIEELTWDPGATHLGTAVKNSPHTLGGPFVYRIISLGTTVGGWRTALNVNSGEADVYLRRGVVPTAAVNDYRSDQIGSDGFVLHSSAFSPSEEWFYLVDAQAGAAWNLASGEPYVLDLGELPAAVLSGTTNVTIGAEGWRFFRTVAPADTLAWRLWLSGAPNRIYVKKDFIPFDFSYLHERSRAEALLVVPDYLQDNQTYFVGVPGARGQLLKFESKQQPISDLGFGAGHTVLSVSGYPYRTYRVPVPIDQIAWQVKTMPGVNNSDLAIRRGRVPNEDDNDAFSEVPGTVQDSVTLVPPTLSDGTFYITVYGQTNRSYALQNGEPVIPTRAFALTNVNDQPSLAGWRYYVVNDIPSQLGTLGWELILSNQPTNTEIALRRNAVPGRWNYRSQGGTFSQGYVDFTDGNGWLQRPGHQADIWYIGVYNGGANLGAFTLDTHAIVPAVAGFNNFSTNVSGLRPGKWGYFRIDVPANALGWDLRITDYAGGVPGFSVQRDTVPDSPATGVTLRDRAWPSTGYLPATDNWPAFYNYADGRHAYGQTLGVTRNNPLEPGTYYVAIRDDSGPGPLTFTFQSRGIGTNFAIGVSNLNFSGPGSTVTGTLAAGEPAFYRLVIPPNQPSWKLRLTPNTGDALMLVQRDFLPNVGAGGGNYRSDGNRVIKQGREYFLVLPQTGVLSGETNYIAVISEGEGSDRSTSRLGTGSINYTLESLGPVAVANLGSLTATPGSSVGQHVSLEGGDVKLFRFTVAPNTPVLEVRLSNRIGHPSVAVAPGTNVPNPHVPLPFSVSGADAYGAEGGTTADRRESYTLITMMNPAPGTYSLTVKAEDSGGVYPDAEADLSVTVRGPTTVAFNAGTSSVVSQPANEWRFFQITVPAGALGWDVRLKDVTGGNPYLFVRRDLVPDPALGSLYVHGDDWPSGEQLRAPYADWTDRYLNADFESSAYQRLVVGRDNPLVPGTYLVGVFNEPGYLIGDVSYTLESRGIGSGFALGITNLNFAGAGSAYTNDVGLAPREAEYFRIVIPPNQRNWKLRLTPTSSGGELMMLVRFNEVPNTAQTAAPWNQVGKRISKLGKEHYMLLPDDGQDFISPGTNYIVVVGEGHFPNDSQTIGAGDVPYILESLGEQSTTDLGLVPNVGAGIISHHVSMEGGEVELFRFALSNNVESLEIRLENVTGFPYFSMVPGTHAPYPDDYPLTVSDDRYGSDGGWITGLIGTHSLLNIANPTPGVYSVAIKAENRSTFEDVECDITITPIGSGNLAFDGGTTSVNGHAEGTWRYFTIEVPADALGWDLRLSGVTGQSVTLYARRDELPEQFAPGVTPGHWQSGEQWAASSEWTGLANPDGTSAYGHIIQVGRGNPLTNGTYRIGVYNGSSGPASYTLTSRGIGASYSIPVTSVGYVSDTPHFGLAPRELAYYAVEVPSNAPSWKLKLDTSAGGEARMIVQKDVLPHIHAGFASVLYGGKTLAKDGDEHYVLLPVDGETNVPGGTYYIAVLSEGVGPSGGRLGSDPSAFTLRSQGALPVAAIGTVPAAGLTLMHSMSVDGGEVKAFHFDVPPNVQWMEFRLANRQGNPAFAIRPGEELPYPNVPGISSFYGADGGWSFARVEGFTFHTFVRPAAGAHSLTVKGEGGGSEYPGATNTIEIEQKIPAVLAFSNGMVSTSLGDNQRVFYEVTVPPNVLGWKLDLIASNGLPQVRARKGLLPSDAEPGMHFGGPSIIIAPPFLGPGTWYVEVKGNGPTTFKLTSNPVLLQRPAWNMPALTNIVPSPIFADTGRDTNGVPLPGDQGTDLGEGDFHFYGIHVPEGNGGLLRAELFAISGNPDLFVRRGAIPTRAHREFGAFGEPLIDFELIGTGTQYGNWVPLDGRTETQLGTGQWYLAVRATASNARYRLRLSAYSGVDMTSGIVYSGQLLAAGDWRYYRLVVPANAPASLTINYSQQQGDTELFVRDTVPPGEPSDSFAGYRRWNRDNKNGGPYPDFPDAGSYTLTTPTLRPDHVYFLGFRALSDASFTVSYTSSAQTIGVSNVIAFYGGTSTVTIPPFGVAKFRVPVPADATSWRHSNTHSAAVKLYLDQGTLPDLDRITPFAIWSSGAENSHLIQFLYGWPWVANQNYYFVATNTSGAAQSLTIRMDGRNVATDDSDGDGLPDGWEILHFGNLVENGDGDYDGDGIDNATELAEGTNPANASSLRPRLTVEAIGQGTVALEPHLASYTAGQPVTLTAIADTGAVFVDWTGALTSSANPLTITMASNTVVFATFTGDTSPVVIHSVELLTGGGLRFVVTGPDADSLTIEAADDLGGEWTVIHTETPFSGTFQFEDTSPSSGLRFYRAQVP